MDLIIIIMLVVMIVLVYRLYTVIERVEDNLVDIEVTYERMRGVLTYLKDCIEHSNAQ